MNKQFLQLFILLLGIFNLMAVPIKINGKDINDIMKFGDGVVTNYDGINVGLTFNDNHLQIITSEVSNLEEIIASYEENKSKYKQVSDFREDGAEFANKMSTTNSIKLAYLVLKQRDIFLESKDIHLWQLFLENPGTLSIATTCKNPLFRAIKVEFPESLNLPRLIDCRLNLETGEVKGDILFLGANKIEILLGNRAFE